MKNISIMHIEDQPLDAELVARELKKSEISFTQVVVSTKEEFIERLDTITPDIILSDHSLPSFNSLEAIRIVRKKQLTIPFILVTANTSEEYAASVIKEGADDYILKDRIQRLPLAILNAIAKFELNNETVKLQQERQERDRAALTEINRIAARLQLATDTAGIGIWEWDIPQNHFAWDEGLYKLYGVDAFQSGSLYDAWIDRVHKDDKRRVEENIRLAITGVCEYNTEFRIICGDRSLRNVKARGVVTWDRMGNPLNMIGVNWDITAQKENEARIMENEYRYRSLFEQATDGICLADQSLKLIEANPITPGLFGFSKEEILALSLPDLLFDGDRQTNRFKFDAARSQGIFRTERKIKRVGGRSAVIEMSTKTLSDGSYLVFGHDITERKEAEGKILSTSMALEHALKDLKNIMDSSLDVICTIDEEGNFVNVSAASELIWGYKPEELKGKGYIAFVFGEDLEKTMTVAEGVKQGVSVTVFENRYVRKDGSIVPVIWSATWDDNDRLMYCIAKDGTEKEKLEILLHKANTLARIGSWDVDVTKGIVYWSAITKEILEVDADTVTDLESSLDFYKAGESRDSIAEKVQDAIERGKPWDVEVQIITAKKNERWVRTIGETELTNGQCTKLYGSFQDIDVRKKAEIRLMELNDNLEKRLKELAISNSELEQFAFVASHDLQEPLRMVTSFLTQIELKYGPDIDEKGRKYISFAIDGAKRMRQIILDLLEFSRVGRIEIGRERFDLGELLEEIQMLFRKEIKEKGAKLVIDKMPKLYACKSPLGQVFQNLISNALKYSGKNGPPLIRVSARELPDCWEFSVADNGIGIAAEYFDKIFIIFQRLHNKDEYSGTGMGLAVTKKIVEYLGGRIWLSSVEGKGSTFNFTLLK